MDFRFGNKKVNHDTSYRTRNLRYTFTIILSLLWASDLYAVSFRARLYDKEKEKPEANMNVMVYETRKFYKTDENGYFQADVPEPGVYTFRVLRPTGMQQIKAGVASDGSVITIFTSQAKALQAGTIDVTGLKEKQTISRYNLEYEEIKHLPGSFGEALKGIQTLPGITPNVGNFGSNANTIIIRGADPSWNMYFYDELPILYPFHYDGLTSVIHNDMIKSIDMYTGPYPASYFNATGGVIEINSVDKVPKAKGAFQVSLWNTTAMYMSPTFGGKGYISVSGKVGYLDKTLGNSGLIPAGIRLPRFTDSQVKFVHNFSDKHQIMFINLTAQDSFAANIQPTYSNDPTKNGGLAAFGGSNIAAGQGYRTTALRYTWTPGSKFTNKFTLINYDPYSQINLSIGSIQGNLTVNNAYVALRQDATWKIAKFLKVDFGSDARKLDYKTYGLDILQTNPNNQSPNPYNNVNPAYTSGQVKQETLSDYYDGYATLHLKLGHFEFSPSARYDYMGIIKAGALGPRGIVSYTIPGLGKETKIFAGGGDYYRLPQNPNSTGYATTVFNKDTGNPHLKWEKARKYSGGVDVFITSRWEFKTEVFKQEYSNLIVPDPYISAPIGLNSNEITRFTQPFVLNKPLNYSNSGNGFSQGFEVLIKKTSTPGKRDWFGWISYTWSQSFRNSNIYQIYSYNNTMMTADQLRFVASLYNNSVQQYANFDRTNMINIVYGWRVNEDWQIGARWTYLTSTPITPIIGDDGGQFSNPYNGQTYWNPVYSNNPFSPNYGNVKRLKPFHRLDIRFDRFVHYEWGYMNWYIEILNVYVRNNVYGQSWNPTMPYSATNPKPSPALGTLQYGNYLIPLFNVGMEAHF